MLNAEQRYFVIGILSLFMILTFKDLAFPAHKSAAASKHDSSEDSLIEETDDPDTSSEYHLGSRSGLGSSKKKEIPHTNLRNIITGPTVKVQYCYSCGYKKAYEEYATILREKYPELSVYGENYPPPGIRHFLSNAVAIGKILVIMMVLSNINPFQFLNRATPGVWMWLSSNRFYGSLMTFFICNTIEAQLVSTGAFEIFYNDFLVWSKIDTGRIPSPPELFQLIDNQNLNKADVYNYPY